MSATRLIDALAAQRAGRLAEAETGYRQVLADAPRDPHATFLLGSLLLRSGGADARPLLRRAAALRGDADSRLLLGNACHAAGDGVGAAVWWRRALAASPGHAGASLNLAGLLRASGDWRGGAAVARVALEVQPTAAALWLCLAACLLAGQADVPAATAADAAIELDDRLVEAWIIRGTLLARARHFAAAEVALRQALVLDPECARAELKLGNALLDQDRLDDAACHLQHAVRLDPGLAEAQTSLGFLLSSRGDLPAAVWRHRRAIALRPDFAGAHSNLAAALLLRGEFAEGWAEYEWRKHDPAFAACYWQSDRPEWQGGPLAGRRLLVFFEQGNGDAIMCARFIAVLAARGASLVLVCHAGLSTLLAGLDGVVATVPRGDARSGLRVAPGAEVPAHDCWIDSMSLPGVLGVGTGPVVGAWGYLVADAARTDAWRARLPTGRKVGLVWAGNSGHSNDHRRSIPLALLDPLLEDGLGFTFISLQRDGAAVAGMHWIGDGLKDYAQTAAAIAALDVVISVDTSVAHLAGALGKPTWLMLPYAPEWRWRTDGQTSDWYGSMRLFRQPAPGNWAEVLAAVRRALCDW